MGSLSDALLWYQKKICTYDKQQWEKGVEQHILRSVDDLPKKTAKLKPELIDVDLVRGSAFPKAKPQHGWIATSVSGIVRVLVLPLYIPWWQQQTSHLVCIGIAALYFFQVVVLYLYFTSPEEDFQDITMSEVMTPVAMMIVLGIVHSQIVATVSGKGCRKNVRRSKRKRLKHKVVRPSNMTEEYESKSSPETASDDRQPEDSPPHVHQKPQGEEQPFFVEENSFPLATGPPIMVHLVVEHQAPGLPVQRKNSDEESGLDSLDFTHICEGEVDTLDHTCCNGIAKEANLDKPTSSRSESIRSMPSVIVEDTGEISSGDEYFVARHARLNVELPEDQTRHSTPNHGVQPQCRQRTKSRSSAERQLFPLYWRRFSDIETKPSCGSFLDRLSLESLRRLSENTLLRSSSQPQSAKSVRMGEKEPYSSCDSEGDTAPATPTKQPLSDLDWPIISNTDCTSDSTDSGQTEQEDDEDGHFDPHLEDIHEVSGQFLSTGSDKGRRAQGSFLPLTFSPLSPLSALHVPVCPAKLNQNQDYVRGRMFFLTLISTTVAALWSCAIWERNECKKVDLTVFDIGSAVVGKVDALAHSTEYLLVGLLCALAIALLPALFRLQNVGISVPASEVLMLSLLPSSQDVARFLERLMDAMLGTNCRSKFVVCMAIVERFVLSSIYFFLLSVAERTFKQRFLYAKHFCHLTSTRRARRSDLPHFRLNKVRNIKTWLSVRSYLKKHGPQRSVDVVVSTAFILSVCLLSFLCVQLLKENDQFVDHLYSWEIVFWCLTLGIYLMRFMILGSKINKKYRNLSVLTTEQINLYLHMEQKPHKKDELMLANNVLKLAIDLLKELESPFKISGLCANPYLYNVTKVVVLSAFSAVLTELLGFKLKLHKIKIK